MMSDTSNINFPETLRVKVPLGLPVAVKQAAKQQYTTPGEWARRVLLVALEAQGVRLPVDQDGRRP